jgi:hypothetical protein
LKRLAGLLVRTAARLLPAPLRGWGDAMAAELAAIDETGPALGFALGCVTAALREAVRLHLRRAVAGLEGSMTMALRIRANRRPRRLAILCALGATGFGFLYLAMAGAPLRYPAVNGAGLALGLLAVVLLGRVGDVRRGIVDLMLAAALLLTAAFGMSADGMTRWLAVGGVLLQPGLILLPILVLRYARSPDALSTLAVALAALAMALQPDRAMAGALLAGIATLALVRPGWNAFIALAAAGAAFAATLARADPSAAVPYVDQVLASSFALHPLAGLAVWTGAALLLVPALAGLAAPAGQRAPHAVFGALWLAILLAAVLGNYPTPLVGYGASAILGYLLSALGLPAQAQVAAAGPDREGRRPPPDEGTPRLRARLT